MFSSSLLHRIKFIKIRHAHMVTCVDKENMKHLQKTCTPAMDTLTLHGKYIHVLSFSLQWLIMIQCYIWLCLFSTSMFPNISYVFGHMTFCYTYTIKVFLFVPEMYILPWNVSLIYFYEFENKVLLGCKYSRMAGKRCFILL